ncbi:MAG: transposase [Anaerolineaceae bacterium]|nr:MAG: transposase [Anaerolineaceae bacterium]
MHFVAGKSGAKGWHTYGYRKVYPIVKKDFACGIHRVARIIRKHGIQPKQKRRYKVTTQRKGSQQ